MTNVNRNLERRALREFAIRVGFQMSAEDTSNLVDSPAANKLGQHRALVFAVEEGLMEKFCPYALPSEEWLQWVGGINGCLTRWLSTWLSGTQKGHWS